MERSEHGGLTFVTDGHLGGYVEGGDPNTTYPTLWRYLVRELGVSSVLDVGCGDGGALRWFVEQGVEAVGIDGIPQDDERIICHDYTLGPMQGFDGIVQPNPEYDLVWSAEFVEHVDERFVPNFLRDFQRARLVLMTHAIPGQNGWHHVNCRTSDYWQGVMAAIGYRLDDDLTVLARGLTKQDDVAYNYFAQSGLAFRRNDDA